MSRKIKLRTPGKRAFPDGAERPALRLVPTERQKKTAEHDTDLKRLLDELKARQKPPRRDDDGPEAA